MKENLHTVLAVQCPDGSGWATMYKDYEITPSRFSHFGLHYGMAGGEALLWVLCPSM